MQSKIPLVSVVMPVFNAAKFISQTLESLLYQTMTDFEVVAVDDCSTDNSIEVVESFRERFDGRLKLIRLPKNTGTPGLPRNVGIQFARGKYIAFLDCDDLYTKTALEEMSTLAEKFQADVVHANDTIRLWNGKRKSVDAPEFTDFNEMVNPANWSFTDWHWPYPRPQPVPAPMWLPAETEKRLAIWLDWQYRWATCASFCRRDFLVANQNFFPDMPGAEDMLFNFKNLCLAEKILHVPNVIYIIRPREGSIIRDKKDFDAAAHLSKWLNVLIVGATEFDKIMSRINFFNQRPDYRYAVIEFFFQRTLHELPRIYSLVPAFKLNETVKQEFHPDDAALSAYLFNTVNVYRLHIMKLQRELAALKNSK